MQFHHVQSEAPWRPGAGGSLLLLALCLLAGGAQAAEVPRYVVGDILETISGEPDRPGHRRGRGHHEPADPRSTPRTTSSRTRDDGRSRAYWHRDLQGRRAEQLVGNEQAHRTAHVDPVARDHHGSRPSPAATCSTTASRSRRGRAGVLYAVEPAPGGSSGYPSIYVVGDILGNVSGPNRGAVSRASTRRTGSRGTRVYFDAVRSGDRWMIDMFYNNDMGFTWSLLDQNGLRRVAHADPHTVIVNDSHDQHGREGLVPPLPRRVPRGQELRHTWAPGTSTRATSSATGPRPGTSSEPRTSSDSSPSHYTLYEVVRAPTAGRSRLGERRRPVRGPLRAQLGDLAFDLVDHTDPHFAVVTDHRRHRRPHLLRPLARRDPGGHAGYTPDVVGPRPIGGDTGTSWSRPRPRAPRSTSRTSRGRGYPIGNTTAGPLNVTILLTATPMKQIVANLSGYEDAVYTITQYPAKGETVPVNLTLEPDRHADPGPEALQALTPSRAGSRPRTTTSAARASRTTTPRRATPAASTARTTSTSSGPRPTGRRTSAGSGAASG